MNKIETTQIGFNEISAEIKLNDTITIRMLEYETLGNLNEAVLVYVEDSSQENSGWCLEYDIENKDLYVNYNQFYDIDEVLTEEEYNKQYEILLKHFKDIKLNVKRLITYFKKYETNKLKKLRKELNKI
jgi:hypothetical protein